jgi:hypothetical protein
MALKVLKPCLKVVDTRTAHPEPKAYQPVYYSKAWRRLVAQLELERGEYCQACGKHATYLEADHIVELKDGGAPDLIRQMSACFAGHAAPGRRTKLGNCVTTNARAILHSAVSLRAQSITENGYPPEAVAHMNSFSIPLDPPGLRNITPQ